MRLKKQIAKYNLYKGIEKQIISRAFNEVDNKVHKELFNEIADLVFVQIQLQTTARVYDIINEQLLVILHYTDEIK